MQAGQALGTYSGTGKLGWDRLGGFYATTLQATNTALAPTTTTATTTIIPTTHYYPYPHSFQKPPYVAFAATLHYRFQSRVRRSRRVLSQIMSTSPQKADFALFAISFCLETYTCTSVFHSTSRNHLIPAILITFLIN